MRLYELLSVAAIASCTSTSLLENDNIPDGYVPIDYNGYTIFVSPDYARDEEGNYLNFSGNSASEYARERSAVLPTQELAQHIANIATHRLSMPTQDPSVSDRAAHRAGVDRQLQDLDLGANDILAGHMKDVVRSPRENRTAIWGGSWTPGTFDRIQPFSTIHDSNYSDYSQGLRLVHGQARDPSGNLIDVGDIISQAPRANMDNRNSAITRPTPSVTTPPTTNVPINTTTTITPTATPASTSSSLSRPTTRNINVSSLPTPGTTQHNLRTGSAGSSVSNMQSALSGLGYNLGNAGVDGRFGRMTRSAVTQFQRDHGLQVDGIAGDQTMSALNTLATRTT